MTNKASQNSKGKPLQKKDFFLLNADIVST